MSETNKLASEINTASVQIALPDKPLHVKVAEALGWQTRVILAAVPCAHCGDRRGPTVDYWEGWPPPHDDVVEDIPRYDTSWEATGPLIEKYKISLISWPEAEKRGVTAIAGYYLDPGFCEEPGGPEWDHEADGPTPLTAVCELLLKLAAQGKLAKEEK